MNKILIILLSGLLIPNFLFAFDTLPMISEDGTQMLNLACNELKNKISCMRSKVKLKNENGECQIVNVLNSMDFKNDKTNTWIADLPVRIDSLKKEKNGVWYYTEFETPEKKGDKPLITKYMSSFTKKFFGDCKKISF